METALRKTLKQCFSSIIFILQKSEKDENAFNAYITYRNMIKPNEGKSTGNFPGYTIKDNFSQFSKGYCRPFGGTD